MKKYYVAIHLLLMSLTTDCCAQNYQELNSYICKLFGTPAYTTPKIEIVKKEKWVYPQLAYYNAELNVIYVLEKNEQTSLVAHELAHSILNKYFIIQPMPEKMQEILAKYAEYLTRKLP